MEHKIATIISYCTRDKKWLKPCIDNSIEFSKEIIVPISSHYFNGDPENNDLIEESKKENPSANFVEFEYDPELYEGMELTRINDPFSNQKHLVPIDPKEIWFWNQIARLVGYESTSDDIEYILFLDVDEIPDTNRFIEWLNKSNYQDFNSIRFESYWYFRDIKYRAIQTEDWNGITLVKKDKLNDEIFFNHSSERLNFINFVDGNRKVHEMGLDGKPMFHHYSWVRTYEEMIAKVKSWSHHKDRNWIDLVNKEFKREFIPGESHDFVHGYDFEIVNPYLLDEE